jgi:hypothetical protein
MESEEGIEDESEFQPFYKRNSERECQDGRRGKVVTRGHCFYLLMRETQ